MSDSGADFGRRVDFYTFAPETLADAIPAYELVREVGKGSMGIVYEARRRSDGLQFAIKVLPPSLTLTERALARFIREGELMRKVDHDGIARVFDVGHGGKLHYFVMEFVDGRNLAERLAVGPLPIQDAARIARDTARALQYAHDQGIVHRDVKPENLILRDDGQVVITDFGLARETGTGSMTESGAIVGTPMFMAPEQVMGERESIGARVDVYGLGATLYTMLAGHPPFEGPSAQSVIKQVVEKSPSRLQRSRRDVPAALEAIVMRAMERDQRRRYAAAAELADDLDAFLAGGKVAAKLPSPPERIRRAALARPAITALVAISALLTLGGFFLLGELRQKDIDSSLQEAESLLRQAANSRDGLDRKLEDGKRRRLLDSAIALAKDVAETENLPRAWFLLGRAAHIERRHGEAIVYFDRAVSASNETWVELLHYRIDCLRHLSDTRSRTRLFDDLGQLVELDPGLRSRCLVAGHLLDVAADLDENQRQQLLRDVEGVLPKQDDDPEVAIARARLAELRGDRQGAYDQMQEALQRWEQNPLVLRGAARMFHRLGLIDESEDVSRILRLVDPDFRSDQQSFDTGASAEFLNSVEALIERARDKPSGDGQDRRPKNPRE